MIKVIKRKRPSADSSPAVPAKSPESTRPTTEATVSEWIEERRRNQIDSDTSSRETIARWIAITEI